MIFSELYSAYYNTVAAIIARILEGERDEKALCRIVEEKAFGESALTLLPALNSGKWQLVSPDLTTPLEHKPTMPLTVLEKRWLKAISLDPRVKLFGIAFEGLEEVEPLFTTDDYCIYDRYADGDPYEDEGYIARFRLILEALREHMPITVEMPNRKGNLLRLTLLPERLEYSEKDDKFRLIGSGSRLGSTVNLARLTAVSRYTGERFDEQPSRSPLPQCVVLNVSDDRNALERVMLHFAHFEKQAERIGKDRYRLTVKYDKDDETELVIRILSFGPLVEVIEPLSFRQLIVERLVRQKRCGIK